MVISVILPLLALRAALGKAQNRLLEPIALAPQHDAAQLVGEVSQIAYGLGVRAGMGLGEAIDICPTLSLVSPDPSRTESIWQAFLARLEAIGAEVESTKGGEAFFRADEIERLYGSLDGVLAITAERLGSSVQLGAAPTRLAAFAVARQSDDRPEVIDARQLIAYLGSLPTAILIGRLSGPESKTRQMVSSLLKLGIERLDGLTALSSDAVADRFGHLGIEARNTALGAEADIRPRRPLEEICESLDLPEVSSGSQLHSAVTILCDRLATRITDLGLSARKVTMEASLAGGGSWTRDATPREPTASADILRLILLPGLEHLPRPAEKLKLRVTGLGPGDPEQIEITHEPDKTRAKRLDEAAHQVRAAVGEGGLMRVLDAELESHLPERRMLLTPYLSDNK
ncbi:MAG: DinB/UmuC family translesion DNA polymerase [Solirubrobacterales bacterium]